VHESVEAVRATGKRWAVSLANAVLRSYQRQRAELETVADKQPADRYAHPSGWSNNCAWIGLTIGSAFSQPIISGHRLCCGQCAPQALQIIAPSWLRLDGACALPWTEQGLCLERPVAVERLPGFAAGEVSVQDAAAQLAAPLLAATAGMRVLDVCAARAVRRRI